MDFLKNLKSRMQAMKALPEENRPSQKEWLRNVLKERQKPSDIKPFYFTNHLVISLAHVVSATYLNKDNFDITLVNDKVIRFAFSKEEEADKAFMEFLYAWNDYYSKTQIVFYGN